MDSHKNEVWVAHVDADEKDYSWEKSIFTIYCERIREEVNRVYCGLCVMWRFCPNVDMDRRVLNNHHFIWRCMVNKTTGDPRLHEHWDDEVIISLSTHYKQTFKGGYKFVWNFNLNFEYLNEFIVCHSKLGTLHDNCVAPCVCVGLRVEILSKICKNLWKILVNVLYWHIVGGSRFMQIKVFCKTKPHPHLKVGR